MSEIRNKATFSTRQKLKYTENNCLQNTGGGGD